MCWTPLCVFVWMCHCCETRRSWHLMQRVRACFVSPAIRVAGAAALCHGGWFVNFVLRCRLCPRPGTAVLCSVLWSVEPVGVAAAPVLHHSSWRAIVVVPFLALFSSSTFHSGVYRLHNTPPRQGSYTHSCVAPYKPQPTDATCIFSNPSSINSLQARIAHP